MAPQAFSHPLALARLADAHRGGQWDVLAAAIAIATHAHPQIKPMEIHGLLDRIGRDIRHLLQHDNPLLVALNHVFFDRWGFVPATPHGPDPGHCHIDQVLKHSMGSPVLLALIYVQVARRAHLTAHGIGLPGYFLVAIDPPQQPRMYLDLLHRGREITPEHCRQAVLQSGAPWSESYLQPIEPAAWIVRLLSTLRQAYTHHQDQANLAAVLEQLLFLEPKSTARQEELARVYATFKKLPQKNN